ncbi:ADP-ribose pyrophosphatase YjhB, NUDIX family [Cohnella sp. OV330]|uniref:NUDIX domain-containing protein n=1 Tax=Cohnella sp. OV330 TaxID=1855288 RepID=UPI0008F03DE2|nr:NUDIX domain-containing protein [Cohnella sp. OV330]SFB61689.1 ADP-ribose pyrophosphatase YjhB, NUDIX family [Cohnella sp. OV330]
MTMSDYYKNLRDKVGKDFIFMPAVVAIIRNDENKLLFGRKHGEQGWGLIAGAIELGETPAEAVCREALEETGLTVSPERIIGVFGGDNHRFTYSNGHKVEYLTIVFECKITGGSLSPDNDEMKDLKYFKESEIPEIANSFPVEIFQRSKREAIFE